MSSNKNKEHQDKESSKDKSKVSARFEDEFGEEEVSDDHRLASPEHKTELHHQIDTLNQALQEAQEKVSTYWERLLRQEAALQNTEKRAAIDCENARKFALEKFGQDLLTVMDSLDQGLAYANNGQATVEQLIDGMNLISHALLDVFSKHGIQLIAPKEGEAFNPSFHEGLSMQEHPTIKSNHIIQVIQNGYMLHNRLLRPARVVVSKAVSS